MEKMKKAYEANKNNKAVKAAAPPVSEVGGLLSTASGATSRWL
ncbi:hypothetical protein [Helicobacter ganmani]